MFNVIVYSEDCQVLRPGTLIKANDAGKLFAIEKISALRPRAGTNVHGGLDLAFKLAGRDEKRGKLIEDGVDTIFFLSDGLPTVGKVTDTGLILEQVAAWNRTLSLRIHTIGVGQDHSASFMEKLATDNQGKYVSRR